MPSLRRTWKKCSKPAQNPRIAHVRCFAYEQPVQLIKETRTPVEATMKHPRRVDYEYERAGTANIFMFTEPLSGWREATARELKTQIDWALEMARLLDGRYVATRYKWCDKVVLVCDNLNTQTQSRVLRSVQTRPSTAIGPPHR